MKSTGIVRGIDALGRIVLPKELRTSMHLDTDTKLEIFVDGDSIVLKKHRPAGSCDFCGEVDEVFGAVCGLLHLPGLPPQDRCTVKHTKRRLCYEPDDRFHRPVHCAGADFACLPLCAGG